MLKVILVRHAEIELPRISPDPSLNAIGRMRAQPLAHIASVAGVTAIFTSKLARTKETVAPLAAKLGLQPSEDSTTLIPDMLASTHKALLFAGHSNTVPQMIGELGVTPPLPDIEDTVFDNIFIVTADATTRRASLVHLKY